MICCGLRATLEADGRVCGNVLAQLRRQLEPESGDAGQTLKADNAHIWLDTGAVETDVAAFETGLKRARRAGGEAESEEALREAVTLYRGELLPGYYADWLLLERDRLASVYVEALQTLRDMAARRKDAAEIRDLTFRLAQEGANDDADASADTKAGMNAGGSPGESVLQSEPEAIQKAPVSLSSLPTAYTRFFGREREMREMLALLNASRLVTLTGMGGVGKTRLAQETARAFSRNRATSAAGPTVVFAPLEAARQPGQIAAKICAALALAPDGAGDMLDQVCAQLRTRGVTLLVLDNLRASADTKRGSEEDCRQPAAQDAAPGRPCHLAPAAEPDRRVRVSADTAGHAGVGRRRGRADAGRQCALVCGSGVSGPSRFRGHAPQRPRRGGCVPAVGRHSAGIGDRGRAGHRHDAVGDAGRAGTAARLFVAPRRKCAGRGRADGGDGAASVGALGPGMESQPAAARSDALFRRVRRVSGRD